MELDEFLLRFQLHRPLLGETFRLAELKPAAVLIPIVERPAGLALLLTRRSLHLRHHAGQICFPGGRQDADDRDLIQTALRETREELDIAPEQVRVLGTLPGHHTVSRYHVTPVLGLVVPEVIIRPYPDEVAEAFELPLSPLLEPHNFRLQRIQRHGRAFEVCGIELQGRLIWGATARILLQLARQIAD